MDYILEGFLKALELLFSSDPETWSVVYATLKTTAMSMAASLLLGVPAGFCLGYLDFPGKRFARTVVDTLLALPTVLIGLLVYAFVSRRGPLGHLGLLFTLQAVAIGQTMLAWPNITAMTANAVASLDRRLAPTLLTLGASRWRLAREHLYEARYGVILAALTAYGRVVTEVGIAMMVGGNIKCETRAITTAIALETGKGDFALGIALGLILLFFSFVLNVGLAAVKRRARQ